MSLHTQKTVELISRMRHDFGNHLQVISGYIDLARYQEVKEYIAAIVEEFMIERNSFESLNAELALYFYEHMLLARDLGIILRYNDLIIRSTGILQEKHEPAATLKLLAADFKGQDIEPVVCLSIYEEEQEIDMVFTCESWERNPVRVKIKE